MLPDFALRHGIQALPHFVPVLSLGIPDAYTALNISRYYGLKLINKGISRNVTCWCLHKAEFYIALVEIVQLSTTVFDPVWIWTVWRAPVLILLNMHFSNTMNPCFVQINEVRRRRTVNLMKLNANREMLCSLLVCSQSYFYLFPSSFYITYDFCCLKNVISPSPEHAWWLMELFIQLD